MGYAVIFLLPAFALARQFDLQTETLATYFKADIAPAAETNQLFAQASGAQTTFTQSVPANFNGEIGVLFTSPTVGVRLGIEISDPVKVGAASGNNAAGTQLMTVDSSILGWGPTLHVESYFDVSAEKRFFLSVGAGYLMLTTTNAYTLTATGQSTYPGIANYTESGSASGLDFNGSLGWEFSFSDAATLCLEAGYRYVNVGAITAKSAVTTFNGNIAQGSTLVNQDGSQRSLNLSGPFAGIGFRFYFKR